MLIQERVLRSTFIGAWKTAEIAQISCGSWSWIFLNIIRYAVAGIWPYRLHLRHSFILQGDHRGCHPTAPCHVPGYIPSKVKLTNQRAVQQLVKHLKATYIYQNAEAFCRVLNLMCIQFDYQLYAVLFLFMSSLTMQCRDTYWVESFNHQLLTYLPKRIHFTTDTFVMRMNLALMDWVCMCLLCKMFGMLHTSRPCRMRMCIVPIPVNEKLRTFVAQIDEHQWRLWSKRPTPSLIWYGACIPLATNLI